MKDLKDLSRAVIEKAAANRSREMSESDVVEVLLGGIMKVNGLGDALSLANLDEKSLLEDNESSADFISREMEKAESLIQAKKNIPTAEALLRKMIEANRRRGVLADTPAVKELRAKIEAAKELRVDEEVDETALDVVNFRKFYTEIQDAADVVRNLLKGSKEEAEAEVDAFADRYYGFFERLWENRHIQEVPSGVVDEWKKRHVSFSDQAFSAKNPKGKKIWCWGIRGDANSMAVARAMRHLYVELDRVVGRLEKANQPAPSATPSEQE